VPTPIYNAVYLVRKAISDALDPLTTSPVSWAQADEDIEPPFVIYQSQDAGGRAEKRLNELGWSGLITVKAIATNQGAAETLMNAVAPGMASLSSAGYTIGAEYERPIVIPPDESGRWTAAHQWRVYLEAA
jgi:hypothetical protein